MGQAMASRYTGLNAGRSRAALVGAALFLVGIVSLALMVAGVASGEVAATLLFVPVFAAGLMGGRGAGYGAAALATVAYVALRREDLSSAAAASAGVLTLTRAGAYAVAGHVGSLARALAPAEGAADRQPATIRSRPASAVGRPAPGDPWHQVWETGEQAAPSYTVAEPVLAGVGAGDVGYYDEGGRVHSNTTMSGAWPPEPPGEPWSDEGGRDPSRGHGGGQDDAPWSDDGWHGAPPAGPAAWPARDQGRPASDDSWAAVQESWRQQHGVPPEDEPPAGTDPRGEAEPWTDQREDRRPGAWPGANGADAWASAAPSDPWAAPAPSPGPDRDPWGAGPDPRAGAPVAPPDPWGGRHHDPATPAAPDWPAAPPDDPWGDRAPTGGTWPDPSAGGAEWSAPVGPPAPGPDDVTGGWPAGPAGPAGAGGVDDTGGWPYSPPTGQAGWRSAGTTGQGGWSSPDADASGGWPADGAPTTGGWPAADAPPNGGWPADGAPTTGGWPAADAPPNGGWPGDGAPTTGGWPAADAPANGGWAATGGPPTGAWPASGAAETAWSEPAGPAGGPDQADAWGTPPADAWAEGPNGDQPGWGGLASDAWPSPNGRTTGWDQPAVRAEPTTEQWHPGAETGWPSGGDAFAPGVPGGPAGPAGTGGMAVPGPGAPGAPRPAGPPTGGHPSLPPLPAVDPETGLWTAQFLRDRLAAEQARSRRTGHSFSMVLVQVPDGPLAQLPYRRQVTLLRELGYQFVAGGVVDHLVHVPDQNQHWFAVILPDTDRSGAHVLERRLRLGIGGYLSSRGLRLRNLESASLTAPDDDPAMGAIWDALIGADEAS